MSHDHPVFAYVRNPFVYLSLVRTYVELNTLYWVDTPTAQGRVRLTNVETGEYVIYGDLGGLSDKYDVGEDECLYMNVPQGHVRVRIADSRFVVVQITDDLSYRGVTNRWCLKFTQNEETGAVSYDFERFDLSLIERIRTLQSANLEFALPHVREQSPLMQ